MTSPSPLAINPECQAGKHRVCFGQALDDTTDQIVACECECHTPLKEQSA